MSIWKTEPLGKVIRQMTTGSTPPTTQKEYFQGEIQWFTPGDIGATPYLSKSSRQISENAIRHGKAKLLKADTLLLTCIGDIGRVGILQVEASCNQQITALNFGNEIDSWFAYYWFVINQPRLTSFANQAVVPILNNSRLQEIEFSYPPLAEQQRIAGLLRRADRLRRLRRYALDVGAGYLQAVFVEMFGELTANPLGWMFNALGEVANIASGVTKGRDFKGKATITTPYLRVANVQDGFLDLSEIKMIEALPSDLEQLRLVHGDVVMTEGGDFDKLGRGAIWEGHVANCIHQNHIFRVRLNRDAVLPRFFVAFLLSPFAKQYFLRASKQTTNLATINMTQLKVLPVPLPPAPVQQKFVDVAEQHQRLRRQQEEALRQAEHLFQTLLRRAFAGE